MSYIHSKKIIDMTTLEIICLALLWVITGCFISYKAKYFIENTSPETSVFFAILFAPVVLIIDVFNRIFVQKWH